MSMIFLLMIVGFGFLLVGGAAVIIILLTLNKNKN